MIIMTVEELIQELEKHPGDMKIELDDGIVDFDIDMIYEAISMNDEVVLNISIKSRQYMYKKRPNILIDIRSYFFLYIVVLYFIRIPHQTFVL